MFGLGYRKRCLVAEARVKELEQELRLNLQAVDTLRQEMNAWRRQATSAKSAGNSLGLSSVASVRTTRSAPAPYTPVFVSAPPAPSPSFDIQSALIGGLVGHAFASSPSPAPAESCSRESFSSGGGGDYGGGGASSGWEPSSSSSSGDSYSSSSSSSSSSDSYSSSDSSSSSSSSSSD